MKSHFYKFLLGSLLLALVFSSCSDQENSVTDGDQAAVNFSAGIRSRAANGQWATNDIIGIAMLAKNDLQLIAPYSNYAYKTNGDGNFAPDQTDKIIYFPQDGSEVTFKSYYPYQNDLGNVSAIPLTVADQKSLPAIDFMSAEHVSGFTKADSKVELRFYHRLSKLIFKLRLEDGETFPVTGELTMKGMKTEATYNLMTEGLAVHAESGKDIPVLSMEEGSREAIVMPRAAGEGISFVFKATDGRVYTALMDKTLELKGGYKYTFTIVLKKTPIEVSAVIEDWIDAPAITGNAISVSVPAGESSGVKEGNVMYLYSKENGKLTDFTYTKNATGGDKEYVWNPAIPIYWENIPEEKNTFYASIIGSEALTDTQLPDILVADDTEVEYNHGIDLNFRHAATKVVIKLVSKDGTFIADELKKATIVLPDYLTGGKEENGRFIAGTTAKATIEVLMTAGKPEGVAIFDPQTIGTGNKLAIVTLNNRQYNVELDKDLEYKAGEALELTLDMAKTAITVSAKVIDWITVTKELTAITVGTPVSGGINVNDKEIMHVYYGDDSKRTALSDFTYNKGSDKWTANVIRYWEELGDETKFYADIVRPYSGAGFAFDYLTALATVKASNGIEFTFNHTSAQVMITLKSSTFTDAELKGAKIILPSYTIYKSESKTENGVFKPVTETKDLTVKETASQNNSALIPAQTISAGTEIARLIINGRTYNVTGSTTVEYKAGQTTQLNITLEKTEVTVSAIIMQWIDVPVNLIIQPIRISTPGNTKDFLINNQLGLYILGTDKKAIFTFDGIKTWTADNKIYWNDFPDATTSIQVAAVSTKKSGLSEIGTITTNTFPWEITAENRSTDLLLANKIVNFGASIDLEFKHALSQVIVKFASTDGSFTTSELNDPDNTVALQNILIDGTADISKSTVTKGSKTGTTELGRSGNDFICFAIPQVAIASASEKALLRLKVGTRNVDVILKPSDFEENGSALSELSFIAGKKHTITINLQKTDFGISATLKDWEVGSNGSITIN